MVVGPIKGGFARTALVVLLLARLLGAASSFQEIEVAFRSHEC